MTHSTVAVVTGSNKGIGYAIVRGLCKQFHGDVYLTARDETRGHEAVTKLEGEGFHPKFHQLDIDDEASIARLRDFLLEKYGGLDLLVNNAGIAYKKASTVPFLEQAEVTLKTNYWGTLSVCRALCSILRSHARVVNLSSLMSKMAASQCSESLRATLQACQSVDDVNRYMTKFVDDVRAGNFKELGWPEMAYGVSKIGVTLMSTILQREIDSDTSRTDIIVNSCSPGYVATDMSSFQGPKTIDEGADTPLYLSLLPLNSSGPRAQFVRDREVMSIWD